MKKNKFALGLSLTILVALLGGGLADAKTNRASEHTPMNDGEPGQSHNKRHKAPHYTRKSAAIRLKAEYQHTKAEEIAHDVSEHGQGKNKNGGAK
jgi:hypothetical protein